MIRLKINATTSIKSNPEHDITKLVKDRDDPDEITNLVSVGSKSSEILKKYRGKAAELLAIYAR